MQPVSRICGRLLPALSVALALSACASSAQQSPVVSADAILRVADMTRSEGDLASAAGLYQKAHELNPIDPHPLIMLGQTLAKLGSTAGAAEAYRAALQLDGTNAEALRGLATALLNIGQPDAAIAQYEKALDAGEDYRLYNGIAVAYDMLGDHASAQTYYRTALQLSPGNLELNNNLALSLALEGRYQEAIPLLQQVNADPMATVRYRQNLAFVYGLAGERDRARQLAERDLDPATVERNMTYFEVLKGMGDDRTMASALGAHYADRTLLNAPAAALPEAHAAPIVAAPEPESITNSPVDQSQLAPDPVPSGSIAAPPAAETAITTEPATVPTDSRPHAEADPASRPLALVGEAGQPIANDNVHSEPVATALATDEPARFSGPARSTSDLR
jgi:Flp pilus assembly protein TadD